MVTLHHFDMEGENTRHTPLYKFLETSGYVLLSRGGNK